jgi:hypothetical protein
MPCASSASSVRLLGPRGLMPNPKTGTVTPDVETAVKNAKAGQMRYRTDKNGIIHGGIGKISFELDAIRGNLEAVLADLKKAKPAASKGVYMKKVTLSTTMGPGVTASIRPPWSSDQRSIRRRLTRALTDGRPGKGARWQRRRSVSLSTLRSLEDGCSHTSGCCLPGTEDHQRP